MVTKFEEPKWPNRLKETILEMQNSSASPRREEARGEALLLLNLAIGRYLRRHGHRFGFRNEDDLHDIASQKSLDLLRRAELGKWSPANRRGPEVMAYLSKVAERGLIDRLRETGRRVLPADENRPEWDVAGKTRESTMDPPDLGIERKDFAEALKDCAGRLENTSRVVWFLRVLCSLSTKEVASHPDVRLNAGHVDVLMHRARRSIQDCMRQKGYCADDMPPGTFAELWQAFQREWSGTGSAS